VFLRIIHGTRYDYSQPVTFAPHAVYLRPRESPRLRLHRFDLSLSLPARRVATNDPEDNALEWAYFTADTFAKALEFRAESLVETLDANPFDFFLKPAALQIPFDYDATERAVLEPCLTLPAGSDQTQLRHWLDAHIPAPPRETVAFLTALNTSIRNAFAYGVRDEPGIQTPAETLSLASGSCRDYAVFLIALCRLHGLAARFVSGYQYESPAPGHPASTPTLHAWVEVYLPGAGWRGLDPTHGIFCDDKFVPLAQSAVAESVNPIQGTFFGAGVTSRMHSHLSLDQT
jgi:transglutaminase-like putative cysteine protease